MNDFEDFPAWLLASIALATFLFFGWFVIDCNDCQYKGGVYVRAGFCIDKKALR